MMDINSGAKGVAVTIGTKNGSQLDFIVPLKEGADVKVEITNIKDQIWNSEVRSVMFTTFFGGTVCLIPDEIICFKAEPYRTRKNPS